MKGSVGLALIYLLVPMLLNKTGFAIQSKSQNHGISQDFQCQSKVDSVKRHLRNRWPHYIQTWYENIFHTTD